jgi:L,D-peptidoglycan transpeptidase YkuD (ErfK/YbiS/YcfS/YnhG family)
MGWCDDPKSKYYNSLVKNNKKVKCEKLFRKDHLYDFFIEIDHNKEKIPYAGSAIFIHLTKNYRSTKGCIALKEKDFRILLKLVKKNTYLKIF